MSSAVDALETRAAAFAGGGIGGPPLETPVSVSAGLSLGSHTPGSNWGGDFRLGLGVLGEDRGHATLLGWRSSRGPSFGAHDSDIVLEAGFHVPVTCGGDDCGPDPRPALGAQWRFVLGEGWLRPAAGVELLLTMHPDASPRFWAMAAVVLSLAFGPP